MRVAPYLDVRAASASHRILAVVAVVTTVVLAACKSPEDPASSGDSLSGAGAFDFARAAPAPPIVGAVEGGTVRVLHSYRLFLDPTGAYVLDDNAVLSGLLTRSLTQYVYDPEQGSMVLVPDLATDLGTPNEDFTEWTYDIRDGVRFEDGTEVTADDVAYGIKRSFDRTAFPGGPSYSNDYFLDGDTYEGPYRSGTNYDGVVVEGDRLILKMERPFPDMPYWGAFPAMGPIPQRGDDPATYGRHPLATGPYRIADFSPRESLTLVRNEHWDPETDPGRHAYPDRYVFRFDLTRQQIDETLLGDSEEADTALTPENVLVGDYAEAERLDRVTLGPRPCTLWMLPDHRKIDEIEVRRAIGYAYPYREAARAMDGIFGVTHLPGSSILPPGFPGRRDFNPLGTAPGETDPDQARALLREAGYAPGEYELSWAYASNDPRNLAATKRIAESFEAAGFTANPYPTPSFEAYDRVTDDPDAPINLRVYGWCSDWSSGSAWFPQLFHSESEYNDSYFSDPAVDAEIDRIGRLPVDEQPAEWGALDETLMTEHYPVITTAHAGVAMLHGSRIGGMNVDNTLGTLTWKDLHVVP